MRRLSALLVLCAASATALAAQGSPIQRGSIQLGGSVGFGHSSAGTGSEGVTNISVFPRFGYFVAPGLELGLDAGLGRASSASYTSTSISLGPGVTYYFRTASPKVFPFVAGRFSLSTGKQTLQVGTTTSDADVSGRNWEVAGGSLFMLGRQVGITGELFYLKDRVSVRPTGGSEQISRTTTYGLRWGVAAFIF